MMNKVMDPRMANELQFKSALSGADLVSGPGARYTRRLLVAVVLVLLVALVGCESDEDCINCVELPPPVVPTGVHSISGNNEVIVEWFDIAYAPYNDSYNENVVTYYIYSRFYEFGDEFDPNREFFYIGEVAWDENYDPGSGLHWFVDADVENGEQYEYAVAAVNVAGAQSALSFEFVADAPLPMSPLNSQGWFTPVRVYDSNGPSSAQSGFDFRLAGTNPNLLTAGVVDPANGYHIRISFEAGIAYAYAEGISTRIQDFGVFTNGDGNLVFEGVSWAPVDGYSRTGKLELVPGHVYVVEIIDPISDELHYAKFGIDALGNCSVDMIWAYQLIPGLPELKAPGHKDPTDIKPQLIKM